MSNIEPFPLSARQAASGMSPNHLTAYGQLDTAPLHQLLAGRPGYNAEETLCRILEDLAIRLEQLEELVSGGAFPQAVTPARRIASVAGQLGLSEVVSAATHVANCADQAQSIALAATLARLQRAFDIAVTEVWDAVAL